VQTDSCHSFRVEQFQILLVNEHIQSTLKLKTLNWALKLPTDRLAANMLNVNQKEKAV
jgi:hypothetical protein